MKNKLSIDKQVENTLEIGDSISKVQASPFFKDKVLNKMFAEKEARSIFSWFTPHLQLATLACVLVLNVYTFIQYSQSNYDAKVSNFAETYTLSSGDSDSLFN